MDAKTLAEFFAITPTLHVPRKKPRKPKSTSSESKSQSQEDQARDAENATAITRNFSNRIPLSELTSNQPLVQQQEYVW